MELLDYNLPVIRIRVVCSKGTYIRALARDIGVALHSGAHLIALERTRIGDVTLDQCLSPDDIDAFLSEKYEAWIGTPRIAEVLSKIGLGDRQKFAEKSVSEKLSAVCAILKAIKAEDFQIDKSESAISSGIFVRARGRVTDNVGTASLKVERGAKK